MQSDQVRNLKQLHDKNARLKKLVAELSLDKTAASKSGPARPEERRSRLRGKPLRIDDEAGLAAREATAQRSVLPQRQGPSCGVSRAHARDCLHARVLRLSTCPCATARENWQLGKNQAYRLYCKEQLQLRSKLAKRRKMVVTRVAKIMPAKPNDT